MEFRNAKALSAALRGRMALCAIFFRLVLPGVLFAVAGAARAEAPDPLAVAGEAPGREAVVLRVWKLRDADRALHLGFSSVAADGYRALLELLPEGDGQRERVRLSLGSALIAEGKFREASDVLDQCKEQDAPAYRLRRAMLAWQARRWDEVAGFISEVDPDALAAGDRGWHYFLKGLIADRQGNSEAAEAAHAEAVKNATTPRQRAEFILGHYRARLFSGEASETLAEELKKQMEEFQGQTTGFTFAQQYAVVLDLLGRKEEATAVIRGQIQRIPAAESDLRDQFLLLDGLISGSASGQGRESLRELLETGKRADLQRIALQRLAATVTMATSQAFGELLTRLIEAEHRLLEQLHLYRAQLALRQAAATVPGPERDKLFEQSTADAELILTRYPGSRLKLEAFEVLAAGAWEQRRYRTAANHLTQLREELRAPQHRGEVGLLIADCYFRAGEENKAVEDYRNAADAYGTVLRDHPDSISPGLLLYQRVLAEIRGGRLEEVARHLEEIPEGVAIEPVFRWQAEWNLVKAMQERGQVSQAYERVKKLLASQIDEGVLLDELRLRLEWLQAKLAFDSGKASETIPAVQRVLEQVQAEESRIGAELSDRITSYSLLLLGQAQLAEGQSEAALAQFKAVRERFPQTDPAIYSILVEARHYTRINRTVDAQQLLTNLADSFKQSPYAPIALYEAALNAQRRGQDPAYQDQAIGLLERLVDEYPGHELAFYARLHQGDLLRRLNRFEAAEIVYLSIENTFPDHRDLVLVQLSLADCYLARAGDGEEQRFQSGISILERLLDLPAAPAAVRAEAGFKLGFANAARDHGERAQQVYWATISSLYLESDSAKKLGGRGLYWIARCFFEYAQQMERQGRLDDARQAYAMIQKGGLPGEALASANLARLMPKENVQ